MGESRLTPRVLDALYIEAMVLADEARSYFESGRFQDEIAQQEGDLGVLFSCESLKVTTRLMHCIAWLVNQRTLYSSELSPGEIWQADRKLGQATPPDWRIVERFSEEARAITVESERLFNRLQRFETRLLANRDAIVETHPVARLQARLEAAF